MNASRIAPTDHQNVWANAARHRVGDGGGSLAVAPTMPAEPPGAFAAGGTRLLTIWRSSTTAKSAVATEPPIRRTMFMTVEALGISAWLRSK